MKFWQIDEHYRSGDRVFAILRHPQVAVLLTCDAPRSWSMTIFDFRSKQAVLKTQRKGSSADLKRYGIAQVRSLYGVVDTNFPWHDVVTRHDMLQV